MTVKQMYTYLNCLFDHVNCINNLSPNKNIYSHIEDIPESLGEMPESFVTFFETDREVNYDSI